MSVKVLYVVGGGRSGGTILDDVLAQLDGCFSTGELDCCWERQRPATRTSWRSPSGRSAAIARMIGEPATDVPFDDEWTLRLAPNQRVSGNPRRGPTLAVTFL